jgi:hypothetical protein
MKRIFFITFVLLSFFAKAQYDTVICIWPVNTCKLEDFHFSKQTILIIRSQRRGVVYREYSYQFKDGKLNGPYRGRDESGHDTGTYENGLKEGLFKGWYLNNEHLAWVKNYSEGKLIGQTKEYGWGSDPVYRISNYVNGKKNGKEISYFENGHKGLEKTFKNDSIVDSIYWWNRLGEKIMVTYNCEYYYGARCTERFCNSFEENFGIGMIKYCTNSPFPQGDEKTAEWKDKCQKIKEIYYLYENPNDKTPAKYADGSYISLSDPDFYYIDPINYNDVSIVLIKQQGSWCQVKVDIGNREYSLIDKRKLWIKKSVLNCELTFWEQSMIDRGWCEIIDIKSNPILKSPKIGSDKGPCQVSKCLNIKEIKGDWARVAMPGVADCSGQNSEECIGWIRWRDENQFLIR